jgi:hypothetical protein
MWIQYETSHDNRTFDSDPLRLVRGVDDLDRFIIFKSRPWSSLLVDCWLARLQVSEFPWPSACGDIMSSGSEQIMHKIDDWLKTGRREAITMTHYRKKSDLCTGKLSQTHKPSQNVVKTLRAPLWPEQYSGITILKMADIYCNNPYRGSSYCRRGRQ